MRSRPRCQEGSYLGRTAFCTDCRPAATKPGQSERGSSHTPSTTCGTHQIVGPWHRFHWPSRCCCCCTFAARNASFRSVTAASSLCCASVGTSPESALLATASTSFLATTSSTELEVTTLLASAFRFTSMERPSNWSLETTTFAFAL